MPTVHNQSPSKSRCASNQADKLCHGHATTAANRQEDQIACSHLVNSANTLVSPDGQLHLLPIGSFSVCFWWTSGARQALASPAQPIPQVAVQSRRGGVSAQVQASCVAGVCFLLYFNFQDSRNNCCFVITQPMHRQRI